MGDKRKATGKQGELGATDLSKPSRKAHKEDTRVIGAMAFPSEKGCGKRNAGSLYGVWGITSGPGVLKKNQGKGEQPRRLGGRKKSEDFHDRRSFPSSQNQIIGNDIKGGGLKGSS